MSPYRFGEPWIIVYGFVKFLEPILQDETNTCSSHQNRIQPWPFKVQLDDSL